MQAVTDGLVASPRSDADSGTMLDLHAFAEAPLEHDPYDHIVIQDFIRPEWQEIIAKAYPQIDEAGSFPLATLDYGSAFAWLIAELEGDRFRSQVEEKFDLDLTGRPTMVTVRGQTDETDGRIHTDSRTKIITILVYFNESWTNPGGRLRLLRSGTSLEDYVAEVEPRIGTLIAFRRGDNSWHGHKPFVGPRRAIQLNWVVSDGVKRREQRRHRVSAFFKKVFGGHSG
jgi:SM-20-related protein